MLTIYTVPHLPVGNNFLGLVTGLNDESLTEESIALAKFINLPNDLRLTLVASSLLKRATETVQILPDADQFETHLQDERLSPIDYGQCHGMRKNDVRLFRKDYISIPFPSGESYLSMAARYKQFLDDVLQARGTTNMLLIAHESTEAILSHICNKIPMEDALSLEDQSWQLTIAQKPSQENLVSRPPVGPFFYSLDRTRDTSSFKSPGIS